MAAVSALALATCPQALAAQATAPAAPATQAEKAPAYGIEDIVVTARKRSESQQDTPIAITALSGDALVEKSITTVYDVAASVPGLTIYQSGNGPQTGQVSLRGQVQLDGLITIDQPVGVYVDGVYRARATGVLSNLVDIDRLEVLKGPQGTLYGRNTTGGAIAIYTKKPTYDLTAEGALRYGTNNQFESELVVNVPLIADKMALRIVGSTTDNDGFGRNLLSGARADKVRGRLVRGTLRIDPSETVNIIISGDYNSIDSASAAPKLVAVNGLDSPIGPLPQLEAAFERNLFTAEGEPDLVAADALLRSYLGGSIRETSTNAVSPEGYPGDRSYSELWGFSAALEAEFDDLTFRSISGYRSVRGTNSFDLDGTPFAILNADTGTDSRQFSQEFQLLGKLADDRIDWIAGAFYFDENGVDRTRASNLDALAAVFPGLNNPFETIGDVRNQSWAVFGQSTFRFAPRWSVTGGLRYSSDLRELRSIKLEGGACAVPALLLPRAGVCQTDQSNRFNDVSWTIGIDFKPTDDVLLYLKSSRGYRSGGQNLRARALPEAFQPFRPETLTDLEFGVKSDWFDRRLRVNAAIFTSRYKDIQRTSFVSTEGGVSTFISNAAEGTIKGFELEVAAAPTEGLTLTGYVSRIEAKYKRFPDVILGDRSNEPFPYVPDWTYGATAAYETPVGAVGVAGASVDWAWRDEVNFDRGTPGAIEPAYGLLNGRIFLRAADSKWNLAVFGRNLTNRQYYAGRLSLENDLGVAIGYAGRPRTVGVELRVRLGG